jgi:acetyl esterase
MLRLCVVLGLLVTATSAARAEIVWRGDFEDGTTRGWSHLLNARGLSVVEAPVREGRRALKVEIQPGDLWKNGLNRVEVQHRPSTTAEGTDRTYRWSVFLPQELSPQRHQIGYWETDKSYKQIMSFEAHGTDLSFVTRRPNKVHWTGKKKLTPGRWHDFVMHVRWSRDPARGLVEIWLNREKIVDHLSMATLLDENAVFFQVGLLRDATPQTEVLYLDQVAEATTVADLLPVVRPQAPGRFERDVTYATVDGHALTLDLYVPEGRGPFPTAIIVHGGALVRGDKQSYVTPFFDVLADAGFAYVTINYRMAPRWKYPAAIEDIERALRWVGSQAHTYHFDRRRLFLLGESAGGYLVSLLGTRLRRGGPVAAVVSFYGRQEFSLPVGPDGTPQAPPASGALPDFFGVTTADPAASSFLRSASPLHQVTKDVPPYLLVHANDDAQVPHQQSELMCARMKQIGARCELFTTDRLGHGLGKWKESRAEQERLIAWLRETLRIARRPTAPK